MGEVMFSYPQSASKIVLKTCLSMVIKRQKQKEKKLVPLSRLDYNTEKTVQSKKIRLRHASRLSVTLIQRKMFSTSSNIRAREAHTILYFMHIILPSPPANSKS